MIDPLKSKASAMPLSKALGYYFAAVIILLLFVWLCYALDLIFLFLIPYFILGVILNRIVLRNLIAFHPIYNTLSNVSNTKLTAIVGWPFFYLTIFIKLAIVKYL